MEQFAKKHLTILFLIILTMSLFSFFKKQRTISHNIIAPNIGFKQKDDPEILAAKNEAQSKIDVFINAFQDPNKPQHTYFSIKSGLVDGDIVEHMWVDVTSFNNGTFEGILDDNPVEIKNFKQGDLIKIKKEDVEDWLIFDTVEKKHAGGFSFKAFGVNIPN